MIRCFPLNEDADEPLTTNVMVIKVIIQQRRMFCNSIRLSIFSFRNLSSRLSSTVYLAGLIGLEDKKTPLYSSISAKCFGRQYNVSVRCLATAPKVTHQSVTSQNYRRIVQLSTTVLPYN